VLLAVDTSTRTTGVALYDGSNVLAESIWASADFHTVELAPAVAGILARSGASAQDLQALAVAIGPGSFTGLRIGLALVKGMALARRLPVVGVPTLDFLAAAQPLYEKRQLVALLRAGRGRLAVNWYRVEKAKWVFTGETAVHTLESLIERIQEPVAVCGELTAEERRVLGRDRKQVLLATPAQSLRRPAYLAEVAWKRWQAGQVDNPASLAPVYLHYQDPIPS
jgi:tRNA threonylcarbamoyladenosine biosynthesis protein TsaB